MNLGAPAQPFLIRLETAHYWLRTIEAADASEAWARWLAEPSTARMLNAPAGVLPVAQIRAYISTFDRIKSHLLGIFEKDTGTLVGIRAIYIDWARREFMVNVLVGETDARGKGARTETRNVIYRYLFEDLGLEVARIGVLGHNAPVIKLVEEAGWTLIHRSMRPAVDGGPDIEQREYQMTRDQNRRLERKRGLFQQAKAS